MSSTISNRTPLGASPIIDKTSLTMLARFVRPHPFVSDPLVFAPVSEMSSNASSMSTNLHFVDSKHPPHPTCITVSRKKLPVHCISCGVTSDSRTYSSMTDVDKLGSVWPRRRFIAAMASPPTSLILEVPARSS